MPDQDSPRQSVTAPRLEYLDGLRGVAAAMVVLHHLPVFVAVPAFLAALAAPNPWVSIFITLSGFCLYLPAAGRERVEMPRPFWEFMRRRARRIVPAWYASLVCAMLLGGLLTVQHSPSAPLFLPTDIGDLLTHLTLTHSMTLYSGHIVAPGYTLGTEFQLYVLMIVLIGVAARAGWLALIAGTVVCYFLPGIAGKIVHHLFSPMFGMPFILGMIAARLTRRPPTCFTGRAGAELLILGLACLGGAVFYGRHGSLPYEFACWGAALATGAGCVLMARRPGCWPARLLSSRFGRELGGFSYSLYLTHFLVLAGGAFLAETLALPPHSAFLWVMLPTFAVAFVLAYVFSLFFERPFLNSKPTPRPVPREVFRVPEALAPEADVAGVQ